MSTAFKELEFTLSSSLQEVIVSSIGSFKTSIESEIKSLNSKVEELTDRIHHLEAEKPSSAPYNLDNAPNPNQQVSNIQEVIHSTVISLLSEEKEKERRKFNFIIHRIPECTSEDALERKEHDIGHVNSVLQDYLKVDVEVETAMWLGKKDPQKTRLLKVQVSTEKSKKWFYATLLSYKTTQTLITLRRYL